ncbi:MAG: hypothetical protein OSA99_01025 [Acidimicrobiales bacterium]|nr:hypothetical protein [Acidimicrobiales bacterium]
MTRRRVRSAVGAAVVAVSLFGCADSQDPGLDPGSGEPGTTSNTLGQCPPGGPDATTPPAGCIGDDGQVLRP